MQQGIHCRLDLFQPVHAEHRKAQSFQLLSAFALKNAHLLAGCFQFDKGTLAAEQQNQSVRHTIHALTGKFKGLSSDGPHCFYKLFFDFTFPHPASPPLPARHRCAGVFFRSVLPALFPDHIADGFIGSRVRVLWLTLRFGGLSSLCSVTQ